jgi:hypothetical protein
VHNSAVKNTSLPYRRIQLHLQVEYHSSRPHSDHTCSVCSGLPRPLPHVSALPTQVLGELAVYSNGRVIENRIVTSQAGSDQPHQHLHETNHYALMSKEEVAGVAFSAEDPAGKPALCCLTG